MYGSTLHAAPDKGWVSVIQIIFFFFLFLHEIIHSEGSLEVIPRGASNEYQQHIFPCRNKKNSHTFWVQLFKTNNVVSYVSLKKFDH